MSIEKPLTLDVTDGNELSYLPRKTGLVHDLDNLGDIFVGETRLLCKAGEDPARFAVRRERPLADAGPWLALPWQGQSPHFELVESICPSCGVLLDVKETRKAPA